MKQLILVALLCVSLAVALDVGASPKSDDGADSLDPNHVSTWVLMEIAEDGTSTVVAARKSHQPVSKCQPEHLIPDESEGHVKIHYYGHPHQVLDEPCVVHLPDPRMMHHDHMADEAEGKFGGGVHFHAKQHFSFTVSPLIEVFHLKDDKNPTTARHHTITQEHHDHFHTLQNVVTINPSLVQPTTLQMVGPLLEQRNFVFISSGYTANERGKFEQDVKDINQFMQTTSIFNKLSSLPYRRYHSTFNLFTVWYPSEESGASHPAPAGDGRVVNNNLDCTYGQNSGRILTCNRAKVELIGSYAPPDPRSTLLVVIVNDGEFGGTGGAGVCTLYNGEKKYVIFIHEIGHAGFKLADEYNYGYSEGRQIPMANCHWSRANPPWQRWIDAGILPLPAPICTYDNYYRPTSVSCLMEADRNQYCPVCASTVLNTLYDEGMDLASPRYPGKYETVYVPLDTFAMLAVNGRIPYHKDETGSFTTEWAVQADHMNDTAVLATNVNLFGFGIGFNGTGYVPTIAGNYTVTVTITDNTNLLLQYTKRLIENRNNNNNTALRQTSRFRVVYYDPANTTAPNCTEKVNSLDPAQSTYCAQCDVGRQRDCALNFTAIPLEQAIDVAAALAALQAWLFGIGGVFIILGVAIFILIWRTMAIHAENNPREVLPLTPGIKKVRMVLLSAQIFLLVGTSCIIIFSIYIFGQLSIFGRTIVIGVIAASVIVWFCSFVGFCAAYYKNRTMIFVNFILLLILFGLALLFTVLIIYVYTNIESDSVKNQLETEWRSAIKRSPQAVCTMQGVLKCSGFNASCYTQSFNTAGSSTCPSNCEVSNQFADPCYLRAKEFVYEKFGIAIIGAIVLTILILVCLVMSIVLGCSIKRRRQKIHKQRKERHLSGISALSPEETELLRKEFNKVDRDGSGDISRMEFSTFYNKVMGVNLTPRELEEYFDKLDADGNGVLSFEEFIKVYAPPKDRKKKGKRKEPEEQVEAPPPIAGGGPAAYADITIPEVQSDSGEDHMDLQQEPTIHRNGTMVVGRPGDIELDIVLDEETESVSDGLGGDLQVDMTAEQQESQRRAEEAAEAQREEEDLRERQQRLAQERPSNIDVDMVLDQMGLEDDGLDIEMDLEMDLGEDF